MKPEQMKVKLEELNEQYRKLHKEIETLEQEYAEAACPWSKDTVIKGNGKFFIVDSVSYHISDWAADCTYIRKDGTFGATTVWIGAEEANRYRVIRDVHFMKDMAGKIIGIRLGKDTPEKLAAWKEAIRA